MTSLKKSKYISLEIEVMLANNAYREYFTSVDGEPIELWDELGHGIWNRLWDWVGYRVSFRTREGLENDIKEE